jgi:hypothetical protein
MTNAGDGSSEQLQNQLNKAGHRVLDPEELHLLEIVRSQGQQLEQLVKDILLLNMRAAEPESEQHQLQGEAMRWASIAKTHFQEGLMAATRAVTKPRHF